MKRITLSIPDDLKKKMDSKPEINWPAVIRQGLGKRLEQLEKLRENGEI
jgi:hypothetical protein